MGTASFETTIRIKGTKDDKVKILNVLKEYEAGNKEVKFSNFKLVTGAKRAKLGELDEAGLYGFVDSDDELGVSTVWGPYGHYGELNDVDIFREMSEVAPEAFFEAEITGETTYTMQSIKAVLENQKLTISSYFEANEEKDEAYLEYIIKKLPYKKFLKLFKLSSDDLDEDTYSDVMNDIANETWGEESLFDLEYEDFVGTLEAFDVEAELDEDDYNAAIEKISKLEIESGGLYDYDDGGIETTLVYDPIAKKYVGNNGPVLKSNQIYDVTDEIRKGFGKIGKASDEASVADLS